MAGNVSAAQVLAVASKYVGMRQYDAGHQALIDRYNRVLPRPSGYRMTYADAWCDAFVTAVADEAGASALLGRECGVERHLKLCGGLGIWLGRLRPVVGDLVMFDWDGGGFADHIGFVAEVSGERFRTIEGNSNGRVERNWFVWNDWRVKGFARPRYGAGGVGSGVGSGVGDDVVDGGGAADGGAGGSGGSAGKSVETLASEVLLGLWGNAPERVRLLKAAGYDAGAVQAKVNQLMGTVVGHAGASVKRVLVSRQATRFYTGEVMDAWVRGSRFDVLEHKLVAGGQSVYLLGYQGGVIGWVKASDVKPV